MKKRKGRLYSYGKLERMDREGRAEGRRWGEGREGVHCAVIHGSWDRRALNIVFTLIYTLKQNRDYRGIYGGGKYRRRERSCLWGGRRRRGEAGRDGRDKASQWQIHGGKTLPIKGIAETRRKLYPRANVLRDY